MTVTDLTGTGLTGTDMTVADPTTGTCAQPARSAFETAIAMAEAAVDENPAWWNEIRAHSEDAVAAAYCSSALLGALLQSAAHRLGVPSADVWDHIRRTGELPL